MSVTRAGLLGIVIAGMLGVAGCQSDKSTMCCTKPGTERKLVVVENGTNALPIVLFEGAPPLTRQAAEELGAYIEKTSGSRPELIEGVPDPVPEHAIWVGYQPLLDELFPGIDFDFKHPEEILIAANGNHVVIAGRDRWDEEGLTILGRGDKEIVGKQQEYGTANAVYTFLQEHLGVRWLWPGELGEDVLAQKTIALAPFTYRYHPQIRARGGVFHYSSFVGGGYGTSGEWTRKQRLQLDSLEMAGGHAFSHWWEKFKDTHPDYFALQPDGTRSGFPSARTVKICQSNPSVWTQWLHDVEVQLERDPNQRVFNASPNDGWASGHCVCENCRAWDHPAGELRTFRWEGMGQQYVALSDRHVTFANKCAALLKERYPDKDYYVLMLAYGHSRPAPVEAVPADNVIISSVANFFGRSELVDRGSTRGTTHKEQFAAWGKLAPNVMWRPNTGSPAGWQQGQPDVHMRDTIENMKFIAANNCIGIFIDGVWEHWATHGPLYYIMAQLTWNPGVDAEAVLKDYYRRGFGDGAAAIEAYWQLLETTRAAFVASGQEYWEVYDQAFFAKAKGFLDQARARLEGAPEIYTKRVGFLRAGLEYTARTVENRRLMAEMKAAGGIVPALDKRVRDNWAAIEELVAGHPYALNWGPIRPQTPRMAGLHPDYVTFKEKAVAAPAAAAAQPTETATYTSAEEAGWQLAFEDDFEREALGDDWQSFGGDWTLEDGALRGSGSIATTRGFPGGQDVGYLRMEFEAETDVEVPEYLQQAADAQVKVGDLSSLLQLNPEGVEERLFSGGYFFQFGGNWNRRNQIAEKGTALVMDKDPAVRIAPGTVHRIVVENDAGQLRMFVDEKPVIAARDTTPILGAGFDRVGFYFYTAAKVNRVRVYVKPLANDLDLE